MQSQDSQGSSYFLDNLPPEIRLEVYSYVFYSTRLSFGRRLTKLTLASPLNTSKNSMRSVPVQMRPAPNSLSLLRVCRIVNGEIGHSWMSQVLFSFWGAHTMLDKLAVLEPSMLAKLRHMRISGAAPMLSIQSDPPTIECGWAHVFKALPGLCLDRLTVLGSHTPSAGADLSTAEQLIKESDGWKELCFISRSSATLEILKEYRYHGHRISLPRLSRLEPALVRRDGPSASVSIYRSSHAAEQGLMISKPTTRKALYIRRPRAKKDYHASCEAALNEREKPQKEVLLVAHRGRGVDCAVKPLPSDIQDVKVVKRRKRPKTRHESIMVETYKHVDDYE